MLDCRDLSECRDVSKLREVLKSCAVSECLELTVCHKVFERIEMHFVIVRYCGFLDYRDLSEIGMCLNFVKS